MGKSSASRRDPLLADALASASAAYLPQIQQILAQRHDLAGQYTLTRRGNAATQQLVEQSVGHAVPDVQNAFAQALATAHAQEAGVQGLGGSVEGAQVGAYDRRVSGDLANALLGLSEQKTAAPAQRDYANQQARAQYLTDQAKVTRSLQDVLAQQSAAGVSAYGKAKQAQLGRALTKRGQDLTHQDRQASLDARKQKAAKATTPLGTPVAPDAAHRSLESQLATAQDVAGPLVKQALAEGKSRGYVDAILKAGVKGGTLSVHDPATGKVKIDKNGLPVQQTSPSIPKVPGLQRGIALDLLFDGHVSRMHVRELWRQGYSVKKLGLPTAASKGRLTPKQQAAVTRPVTAVIPG